MVFTRFNYVIICIEKNHSIHWALRLRLRGVPESCVCVQPSLTSLNHTKRSSLTCPILLAITTRLGESFPCNLQVFR